jgi:peptidylprolyl isomerase
MRYSFFGITFIFTLLITLASVGCDPSGRESGKRAAIEVVQMDGIKRETLEQGKDTGAIAETGKRVSVHYVGTFESGEQFDSSRDRNQPFTFTLGAGQVISGWDQGVNGMKEGQRVRLTVPPEHGYGARQVGPIPPNTTLYFDIELLEVL